MSTQELNRQIYNLVIGNLFSDMRTVADEYNRERGINREGSIATFCIAAKDSDPLGQGFGQHNLSRINKGHHQISVSLYIRLCKACGKRAFAYMQDSQVEGLLNSTMTLVDYISVAFDPVAKSMIAIAFMQDGEPAKYGEENLGYASKAEAMEKGEQMTNGKDGKEFDVEEKKLTRYFVVEKAVNCE